MLSGVCPALTRLDDNFYAATLRNAGILLPNEYVYHTNSMQRSRDENMGAQMGDLFLPMLYSLMLHKKNPQIFCIVSHTQASSNERTQRDQLQRCNLLAILQNNAKIVSEVDN